MWNFLTRHLGLRPHKRRSRACPFRLLIECLEERLGPSTTTFAVIGDYGLAGQPETDVAALVHGWNPDVILTVGDNNYQTGSATTIDANIGQYYHDYISPYLGSYGAGATTNRFFPTLGHHDWGNTYPSPTGDQPYLNYFTGLPGNGRYYTFTVGLVQFFALDSDDNEPDGNTSTSTQGMWLQSQLAASTALYKIVYDHDPPYSSSSGFPSPQARWPYQAWGATAVISGHSHAYERLSEDNNFPYFVDGLGGEPEISSFDAIDPGSQVRYNADFGALLVTANASQIQFQFITRTGAVIDSFAISAPTQTLTISPTTLPNWTVNQAGYNQTLNASGGTGLTTFSTSAGALPSGLTLTTAGVLSGKPTSAGTFTFTVTATDSGGASGSQSYTVTMNPALAITTTALPGGEATLAYGQTISATGGTGPYTFGSTSGTVPPGLSVGTTGVLSGTPTTAGSYTFTVTVTDTALATANQTYTIAVGPGPFSQYQVTIMGSGTVQAGNNFNMMVQATDALGNAVTSYNGPAMVTATLSPTSSGSSFPATVAMNNSGFGFLLVQVQKVGVYTITASSGSFTGSSGPLTVTPGPLAALAFAAGPVSTPTGVTLPAIGVQVLDAYGNEVTTDNTDVISISASGPGSFKAGSTTTATVNNGVAGFFNLTLIVPGAYQLNAVLANRFITSSTVFKVAPLQVVAGSFTGTPSGFSLQFNTAFLANAATPVLYGQGFAATAPVPSVTLTQTQDAGGHGVNKPITGSLVLTTATNTITFLATTTSLEVSNGSPLLPDGVYTAVVHGTAAGNGFEAPGAGGYLDGLGTGMPGSGDYTQTFVVSAAHDDVVWVPAMADGPGQALNAPGKNRAGGGYPLYLNAATPIVTSVQATLNYNPALLTVTGVTGAGFALLSASMPGQAVLQYSGPALPAGGQTPIGFLVANVPSGTIGSPMPYRAMDLLHLSNVVLNGGAIPVATGDALHLVGYVGDADGNGAYSSNDAVLITRALLNTDTGFAAYPLVDPVIVADTDGDGFIAADAPLQANEAGVGLPAANLPTPPIPAGVVFQNQIAHALASTALHVRALVARGPQAAPPATRSVDPLEQMIFEAGSAPWTWALDYVAIKSHKANVAAAWYSWLAEQTAY